MAPERSDGPFATLTHARLRAEQGDVAAALRIVGAILEREPDDGEARDLAASLRGSARLGPAEAARRRLTAWLARVAAARGDRRVR